MNSELEKIRQRQLQQAQNQQAGQKDPGKPQPKQQEKQKQQDLEHQEQAQQQEQQQKQKQVQKKTEKPAGSTKTAGKQKQKKQEKAAEELSQKQEKVGVGAGATRKQAARLAPVIAPEVALQQLMDVLRSSSNAPLRYGDQVQIHRNGDARNLQIGIIAADQDEQGFFSVHIESTPNGKACHNLITCVFYFY